MPGNTTITITFDYIDPLLCHAKLDSLREEIVACEKAIPFSADHTELSVIEARNSSQTCHSYVVRKSWDQVWRQLVPLPLWSPASFGFNAWLYVRLDTMLSTRNKPLGSDYGQGVRSTIAVHLRRLKAVMHCGCSEGLHGFKRCSSILAVVSAFRVSLAD